MGRIALWVLCNLLLVSSVVSAPAQAVPTDNEIWRGHCLTLVQNGVIPPPDSVGITPPRMEELARDRSEQGQHFVACSLFMAAAGDQAAGGNNQQSRNDFLLAKIEQKVGLGQKLSFGEKLTRSSEIISSIKSTSPPTQAEAASMAMILQPGGAMPGPPVGQGQFGPVGAGPAGYPGQAGPPAGAPPGYPSPNGGAPMPAPGQMNTAQMPLPGQPGVPQQGGPAQNGAPPPGYPGQSAAPQMAIPGQGSAQVPSAPPPGSQAQAALVDPNSTATPSAVQPSGSGQAAGTAQANPAAAPQATGAVPSTSARQKRTPGGRSAAAPNAASGTMPVGRYTCHTAPAVIANGGAYGVTNVTVGQFGGYMWIIDSSHYAGADIHNTGTYRMQGNLVVAQSGPYQGKDNKLTWAPQGVFGRPTIFLAYLNEKGDPIGGLACTYDGPPAQ